MVVAFLVYFLSWDMLQSGPEDGVTVRVHSGHLAREGGSIRAGCALFRLFVCSAK